MLFKRVGLSTKKSLLIAIYLLAFAVTASADTSVKVASNPIDFGQLKPGEIATAKFQLTNTGSNQLTIQFMEFSEPGMRANVQPIIAAGSSSEILVTWDTSGLSGEVIGKIILTFDDPQNPKLDLVLTGTVNP